MKRVLLAGFLIVLLILSCYSMVMAKPAGEDRTPHTLLNIYEAGDTAAVGLKQEIWKRFYLSSNIEYVDSSKDLALEAGVVYFIPYNVELGVFFGQLFSFDIYLYTGAGLQYLRNTGDKYSCLMLGVNYLIFFTESVYPLEPGVKPELRAGLSFSF